MTLDVNLGIYNNLSIDSKSKSSKFQRQNTLNNDSISFFSGNKSNSTSSDLINSYLNLNSGLNSSSTSAAFRSAASSFINQLNLLSTTDSSSSRRSSSNFDSLIYKAIADSKIVGNQSELLNTIKKYIGSSLDGPVYKNNKFLR
ncbi:MAG: hypothetical protein MZU97_06180 [Bacillus subtilis]|nr:hypothetical protein [Bacillus subtilis]